MWSESPRRTDCPSVMRVSCSARASLAYRSSNGSSDPPFVGPGSVVLRAVEGPPPAADGKMLLPELGVGDSMVCISPSTMVTPPGFQSPDQFSALCSPFCTIGPVKGPRMLSRCERQRDCCPFRPDLACRHFSKITNPQEDRMNTHRNIRLTPYSCEELVRRVLQEGMTVSAGRGGRVDRTVRLRKIDPAADGRAARYAGFRQGVHRWVRCRDGE